MSLIKRNEDRRSVLSDFPKESRIETCDDDLKQTQGELVS